LLAAQAAMDGIAYEDAVNTTERALATLDEVGDQPDHLRRARLLLLQSAGYERLNPVSDHARGAAYAAAAEARAAGSAELLADAVWPYCRHVPFGADPTDAVDLAEDALAMLDASDTVHRSRVMAVLAMQRAFAGQRAAAVTMADESLELARATEDKDTIANA